MNAAHGLGGRCEEITSAVPALGPFGIDQPQIRLVDERRGLQCLPGLLVRQFLRGQLAEFVVDERQQLLRRVGIAPLNRRQNLRDVRHRSDCSAVPCSRSNEVGCSAR
jgi:hypothetical protein